MLLMFLSKAKIQSSNFSEVKMCSVSEVIASIHT